jgi:His-Xaa-Ser system protein HxsD
MTVSIDRRIYSDECISKALYSLADRYNVERSLLSETEEILNIIPKSEASEAKARSVLFSCLNDYKLRCIIEHETHDIRTILYAKAFTDCDDITEMDLE